MLRRLEGVVPGKGGRQAILGAWMLEDAEADALLLWLDRPGDGVVLGDLDPSHHVALNARAYVSGNLLIMGSARQDS